MPSDRITMEVRGLKELERELSKLPNKIAKGIMRRAMNRGADVVVRAAKRNLVRNQNVESGQLIRSVKKATKIRAHGLRGATVDVRVGLLSQAFYGRFLEFGTKHQAAKPFMGPALDSNRAIVLLKISESIRKDLAKAKIPK
ncbi:hypothetical protein LCGC14_1234840 [marine sediment metagenome]|uniref:HK97 gp10 family phage protein n=1 Tax=marine sediment metagenome TaxID=412755 RepID=A0A0F9PBR7_9ZZZZ